MSVKLGLLSLAEDFNQTKYNQLYLGKKDARPLFFVLFFSKDCQGLIYLKRYST